MPRPRKHLPDGSINPLWWPLKSRNRKKAVPPIDPRAEPLVESPFPCPNCDVAVVDAALFCTDLCRDKAKYVRYYRARIDDGTICKPDIQDAIKIRLAQIFSGGYDVRRRLISKATRRAVLERDRGLCCTCGVAGTEIDHIRGSGGELTNLQLLCWDCHVKKTTRYFRRISKTTDPELWAIAEALEVRVQSPYPARLCDHPDWEKLWPAVRAARRRRLAAAPDSGLGT